MPVGQFDFIIAVVIIFGISHIHRDQFNRYLLLSSSSFFFSFVCLPLRWCSDRMAIGYFMLNINIDSRNWMRRCFRYIWIKTIDGKKPVATMCVRGWYGILNELYGMNAIHTFHFDIIMFFLFLLKVWRKLGRLN